MSEQTNQPQDELIGQTLGQYEILEEIGRGGMATVYRARQLSINRVVAVKVLPRNLLHDPGFFERFEREVDVVAHLEHPHILPIYDYGKADGVPYIAMRYLAGGSLAQLVRRGLPRLEDLDRPLTQVGQALDYAHQQGVIHRDIKPGNIMLDENGNAYLSDFGIARVLGSNLTGSAIIGTPAYMSPEQAHGLPLDARSDIYALGIVLFEMITGREPYQAETPMALLLKHINEPIPPISQFRPGVPPGVEAVIGRATAKDPNTRYSSTGEMARDFSEALRTTRQNVSGASLPVEDAPTMREAPRPTPYPPPYATPPLPQYPAQMPYPPQGTPYPAAPPTPYPGAQQSTPYPPGYAPPQTPYPQQQTPYPGAPPGMYPGGQPTPYPYPPPLPTIAPRRRLPLAVIAAGVVLLAIVGAVFLLPGILPSNAEIPVTRIPVTLAAPTPFAAARVFEAEQYHIAVPNTWRQVDLSQATVINHYWDNQTDAAAPPTAYVSVALLAADLEPAAAFRASVERYTQQYLASDNRLPALIDEATAPDGTIRQSYRREASATIEAGQMDVFFIARAPYLVVVQLYSADSTGSTLVPTFQKILDSLQVNPAAS